MLAAIRRDWRLSPWNRMPGSQYRRGRDFEYATRDHLREHGYEVVRSAGSKTKIDLIGIKPGELLFIQCKVSTTRALPSNEWDALLHAAAMISDAKAILASKVEHSTAPRYWRLLASPTPGRLRRPGIHFEPWRPDGASPSA